MDHTLESGTFKKLAYYISSQTTDLLSTSVPSLWLNDPGSSVGSLAKQLAKPVISFYLRDLRQESLFFVVERSEISNETDLGRPRIVRARWN
ncbi:hypothetical protein VNO77_03076 [Canavalia gladiata]|uniref:Uncharacterized protein n=1 Tax=Canavalia gladiata TaxID=3824 RepID=A0AAN9MU83_CANGL